MSRQQAVQQYVNSLSSASCSALRQTGCCTAVCVTGAGIFHVTFKMCLNGNTVHRPGVSKRPVPRRLSYSNEWFLKNEAVYTLAFQKYAPRKFLLVLVMKREVDNSIIVVATVEGVKAVNPVTFLVTAREAANARSCERNTQETPLTSGFHATTDGQLPTAAKAGPRGPGLYGPSLGAFWICGSFCRLLHVSSRKEPGFQNGSGNYCERTTQTGVPLWNLWLEPFDKPQISQEVYVGVVEGVFATGVPLAPMVPLPNAAEAQEPEIRAPLPYVDAASLHPLEYAYARSQEGL